MAICYPLSACGWLQNKWPRMTLSANFTSKSVFDVQGCRALTFALARLSCLSQSPAGEMSSKARWKGREKMYRSTCPPPLKRWAVFIVFYPSCYVYSACVRFSSYISHNNWPGNKRSHMNYKVPKSRLLSIRLWTNVVFIKSTHCPPMRTERRVQVADEQTWLVITPSATIS